MPSRSLNRYSMQSGEAEAILQAASAGGHSPFKRGVLYQSAMVKAVASWDAYVNDVVRESIQRLRKRNPVEYRVVISIHEGNVEEYLKKFNVPNSENVRTILQQALGLDPVRYWGRPRAKKNGFEVAMQLDEIVSVRHSIAHGFPMKAFHWNQDRNDAPALKKSSVASCIQLVSHVARQTDAAVASHLETSWQLRRPW